MKYLIEVEATAFFTRTFEVEAEDEHAALAAYQANAKEVEWVKDSNDNAFECDEDGDTACVYMNDAAKTLLIDVADLLAEASAAVLLEEDGWPDDADMVKPQEEN